MWKTILMLLVLHGSSLTVYWDKYVETGTLSINVFQPWPISATITYLEAKNNTSYSYALAISSLDQQYSYYASQGRYSLRIRALSIYQGSMEIEIINSLPNLISLLEIRYLTIERTFTFVQIQHISVYFSGWQYQAGNSVSFQHNYQGVVLSDASGSEKLMPVLNGFDISDKGNDPIGLVLDASVANSTIISLRITSQHSEANSLWYIGVDVLVIHLRMLNNVMPGSHLPVSYMTVTWDGGLGRTSINQTHLYFLGVTIMSKTTRDFIFHYTAIIDNTSLWLNGKSNQTVKINYIVFESTVSCSGGTAWNEGNMSCSNCSHLFNSCQTCNISDCFSCINNSYALDTTDCKPCSYFFAECQTCDSSTCLSCFNNSYAIDATECMPCGSLYANCQTCDSSICLSCQNNSYAYETTGCTICSSLHQGCLTCDTSACFSCENTYTLTLGNCLKCSDIWDHCEACDPSTCTNCTHPFVISGGSDGGCMTCQQKWPGCQDCSDSSCSTCLPNYVMNGSQQCEADCSLLTNCSTCQVTTQGNLSCLQCFNGFININGKCQPNCGDGIILPTEQCDDGNNRDKDGCSFACSVEKYFHCDSAEPTVCQLTEMNTTVVSLTKVEGKNQVELTLQLSPQGVVYYNDANWTKAFGNFSHDLNVNDVVYDPETNQLKIKLAYNENLQGQAVTFQSDFSQASSSFNVSSLSLTLPSSTTNNQALYLYSDSTYQIATAVKYLSLGLSALAILMLIAGFFGCKLQSIQAIAVLQVSGLLTMTLKETGPTYEGLLNLSYSLGLTTLFKTDNYYEDSELPTNIHPLLYASNPINLINILLIVLFGPLLIGLILKIVSSTIRKDSTHLQKAYKYAIGTYTYYGILFLAYGELACLAVNLRYFKAEMDYLMGIAIGVIFAALLILWVIASVKYPVWFGSFKNKFRKFQISYHFYCFSSLQRVLTSIVIVCLSPGLVSSAVVCVFFTLESIFLAVKKPYFLTQWRRPLMNKLSSVVICLLYVGATVTTADSMINQFIPLAILAILTVVVIVGVIGSITQLKEFWQTKQERAQIEKKTGPEMTVQEAQSKLMRDFEMQLMPNLSQTVQNWHPIENDSADLLISRWQNYEIVSPLGKLRQQLKTTLHSDATNMQVMDLSLTENKEKNRMQIYADI